VFLFVFLIIYNAFKNLAEHVHALMNAIKIEKLEFNQFNLYKMP
jgi:hypothetical protein